MKDLKPSDPELPLPGLHFLHDRVSSAMVKFIMSGFSPHSVRLKRPRADSRVNASFDLRPAFYRLKWATIFPEIESVIPRCRSDLISLHCTRTTRQTSWKGRFKPVDKNARTYLRRVSMNLPEDLLINVQELALKMRRSGKQVSFSALVEVALKELLARDNVLGLVRKHGASARRNGGGSPRPTTNGKLDGKVAAKLDGHTSAKVA